VAAPARLDVQLCGGLRVSCGGDEIVLRKTARQGRLALAYLALNHDRAVSRDELMERVWTDPDPLRVSASLSQTLSRLRQVLGRERLQRLPGGAVRLSGPLRVDVAQAAEVLKDGRLAVGRADWTQASEASRTVLAELAGEVLAGDHAEWLEEVRRTVADLRVEALELRATAALRLGAWGDALAAARSAVAAGGMRESAWALLIEAQAAHGDVAVATQTFHDFRRRLIDESGLTPSRELIELHRRLVEGEPTGDARVPTDGPVAFPPALSLASGDDDFVGREDILRRLRARYAQAMAGTGQFVLLCGEPGIGKTRLAGEFAHEAHADGAIVLYGRSDAETLVPYQPFVTAIAHYVTECGNGALAHELGAELSELGRLLPGLARRMPELREPLAVEPEMRRYRLFNAVANVLGFVARERPAVLILDDLHWADPSTALLLQYTVQELVDVKLIVLGTLRDVESCRSEHLADFLARPQRGLERVSLNGLDAEETAALVTARQGLGATKSAVGVLLEATGGNPLLLAETLKSLAESQPSGEGISEQAVRRVGVPEGAKHVIRRRLERLTGTTQRVLADASVVGAEFDVRVLEVVADLTTDQIIAALEEAVAAGLLREVPDAVDRFSFSHALVREELCEGQSAARRRRLHHKIGEALEATAGPSAAHPAELAHHFSESRDPGDADKALTYSLEAGHRAAASLAHEDAARHFRRALLLLAPGAERLRCEVLLALGTVELRQGSADARRTFAQASQLAARNALPELLGHAALGFASRYTEAGVVDTEGIAMLRTACEALGDGDSPLRAELTARLAGSLHFAPEPGEAERLSLEALTMARRIGDSHALAAALDSRHAALLSIEHLDERLRLSHELVELAQAVGERELKALGHHRRIYDLLEAARAEEAERERAALDALAQELRQPLYQHFSAGWEVVWAHMAGNMDEIEPLAERFHALGIESQARDTETVYTAQLIALRRRQERLSDFVSTVRSAVEAHPTLLAWRAVLPLAHVASGDPRAAVAEFEWFAHDGFSRVRRDMFWFTTVCVLAETCALLQDTARAQVLYELLEPFRERNVQVTQAASWGSSERFLGLLAAVREHWDTAEAHFESAIAKNEAGGNAAAASLVRRDLAKMLVARHAEGDLGRAVDVRASP
jgi:DNA-binding SARP family transcriptional activator